MATVYLARDLKHDREVAVKVLRDDVGFALGAERFRREIELVTHLSHPHILPIYDSGEADGELYYVMPFVAGESLRARLNRERQLPLEDALRITCEVASALDHSHRHGIIHRDIKPENILLYRGEAMVADFGIALAAASAGRDRLTETGLSLGTPAYMSPEQASADPKLDGRTDQYSLACVVYEMLTGNPPYTGGSMRQMLMRHSMDPVPSARATRSEVPEHVSWALVRAMAKEPNERFASAAEFSRALSRNSAMIALRRTESLWSRVRTVFTFRSAPKPAPHSAPAQSSRASTLTSNQASAPVATAPARSPMGIPTPIVTTPSGRLPLDSLAVLPFTNVSGDADSE
jgi:eukaryotic-like serine/threonine-protein kinase